MGFLSRVIRLCKADLHGVMDRVEDKNLMLRQHLREMQAVMAEGESRIERMEDALRASRRRLAEHAGQLKKLEADRDLAVAKGKDEVARILIRKCHPLRQWVVRQEAYRRNLAEDLTEERERLSEQTMTFETLRLRVAAVAEGSREGGGANGSVTGEPLSGSCEPSEAEVEWELFQLKEALACGRTS